VSLTFQALTECMHFALHDLSNSLNPSVESVELPVPEPLEAKDIEAVVYYPWRAFINRYAVYALRTAQVVPPVSGVLT